MLPFQTPAGAVFVTALHSFSQHGHVCSDPSGSQDSSLQPHLLTMHQLEETFRASGFSVSRGCWRFSAHCYAEVKSNKLLLLRSYASSQAAAHKDTDAPHSLCWELCVVQEHLQQWKPTWNSPALGRESTTWSTELWGHFIRKMLSGVACWSWGFRALWSFSYQNQWSLL